MVVGSLLCVELTNSHWSSSYHRLDLLPLPLLVLLLMLLLFLMLLSCIVVVQIVVAFDLLPLPLLNQATLPPEELDYLQPSTS